MGSSVGFAHGKRFRGLAVQFNETSTVGCDLDGVLGDIVQQLMRFSRLEHRIRLTRKHIVSENIETCAPIRREQLQSIFKSRDFFRTLPVVPHARKALLQLRAAGFSIHIVTDRFWHDDIRPDTTDWLIRHRIPFDSVEFAGKAEKQQVANKLKLQWFI